MCMSDRIDQTLEFLYLLLKLTNNFWNKYQLQTTAWKRQTNLWREKIVATWESSSALLTETGKWNCKKRQKNYFLNRLKWAWKNSSMYKNNWMCLVDKAISSCVQNFTLFYIICVSWIKANQLTVIMTTLNFENTRQSHIHSIFKTFSNKKNTLKRTPDPILGQIVNGENQKN